MPTTSIVKQFIILSAIVGLSACSTAKFIMPDQSDVDRVATKYPGYTLTDLNRGKTLFENNCGKCHGLKNPSSRTAQKWNAIVPAMCQKINRNGVVVDKKAQEDILRYVVTMSDAPKRSVATTPQK